MMCMNGYILFSMMMSKGGMENVNNLSKKLLKLTYLILLIYSDLLGTEQ